MKDPNDKVLPMKKKLTLAVCFLYLFIYLFIYYYFPQFDLYPFPFLNLSPLQGDYTCNYIPKIDGDHKVLISIDGTYLNGDGVPHIIPCMSKEALMERGMVQGEKGILKIFLEEDEVLSSMNLSNTFKMINITDDTRSGEVKRLMIDKMSKQLDDVQISSSFFFVFFLFFLFFFPSLFFFFENHYLTLPPPP